MSSFIRKRVRGLLKTTFSTGSNGLDDLPTKHSTEPSTHRETELVDNEIVFEKLLNGMNGRKVEIPETYSGKTGLDLPVIHLGILGKKVKSCFTGPDGGLTKVQQMRQQPICRMANLDDELSLSSYDDDENSGEKLNISNGGGLNKSLEALGFLPEDLAQFCSTELFDWTSCHHFRAFGCSTSLYEKHPITGLHAGTPIADVFGIIARENNAIFALADGVNWGEGARLAARCAVRGALDHLNRTLEEDVLSSTTDVFHQMLAAFHAGHALILQEGGSLTTLCLAFVAPIKDSNNFVLCVCNVGDSLCFVYNPGYGVREVTLASHDIGQMRDMRDAGGALGPVDGRNPQLHNLTCSMTFVQEGDLVFITSDGVSDNFDPVVGKFCAVKRLDSEKENDVQLLTNKGPQFLHKTRSDIVAAAVPQRQRCNAMVPCVDSFERHELMLIRMADVIAHGVRLQDTSPNSDDSPESGLGTPLSQNTLPSPRVSRKNSTTAADVCRNLVLFAQQLSQAKRRTLEDPELYRTRTHSRTEERLRRKMVRSVIMELPGKLDHASVVAFKVGEWEPEYSDGTVETPVTSKKLETVEEKEVMANCSSLFCKPSEFANAKIKIIKKDEETAEKSLFKLNLPPELEPELDKALSESPRRRITKSPYEEQPCSADVQSPARVTRVKKSHARGSAARHTLGVDVSWLKKLVTTKEQTSIPPPLAAHSSKVNSQASVAETPLTPLSPGSRHQRLSFAADSRAFSFKKFFIKSTKSEAQVLPPPPLRSPNRG